MSYLIKKIFENKTARILFYFYFIIIILTTFFLVFNYYNHKKQIAQIISAKLWSVVKTAASQTSGDQLENLLSRKPYKDDLVTKDEDSVYRALNKVMARVDSVQEMLSPLYVIRFNKTRNVFQYVVRSDDKVYYLHDYKRFPKELKRNYEKGGFLPVYETENGTWLSAFEPIRNQFGDVVGVVEADVNAKVYFERVKEEFLWMLFYSLLGVIIIALVLLPVVVKILKRDEEHIREITFQKETIEAYSSEVQASSRYASNIQKALVRKIENQGIIDSIDFLSQPRDIVSGDFRWSYETSEYLYFAVADCTGHGIPGAVLSVIGATILNGLFVNGKDKTPCEILVKLDEQFSEYINLSSDQLRMDGMDIGLLRLNKLTKEITFSGALQNLVYFNNGSLQVVKGCRNPIGASHFYPEKTFKNYFVNDLRGETVFFLFTDGFQDQFGGERGKKMGVKKFLSILEQSLNSSGKSRINFIEKEMEDYQGQEVQVDDRLLLTIEMNFFA